MDSGGQRVLPSSTVSQAGQSADEANDLRVDGLMN